MGSRILNVILKHRMVASLKNKVPMIFAILGMVMMFLAVLYPYGMNWYGNRAADRFVALVQQDQYRQAKLWYYKTCANLPGAMGKDASRYFRQKAEAGLELWTGDYLAQQLNKDLLDSRIDVLSQIGIKPGNLTKCRNIIYAQELANHYEVTQAGNIIKATLQIYPNDPLLVAKQEEYRKQLEQMVIYRGPIQHIFFHPLIAYPELAFDQDAMSKGFNDWFVTIREFNLIIESLYKNNYILVNINDILEKRTVNGATVLALRELRLPPGKKPLILSIDDLNYYPYMIQNGTVFKLVLDKQGNIATYSVNPAQKEIIAYDNEIIPILDEFVRKHPDFSYKGAKGIIALTGYQGVLGYRTNDSNSPAYADEEKQARAVIQRLKATGWSFASHGYGHLDTPKISLERLAVDTLKWKAEVEPLVGPSEVYIYPFGSRVSPEDARFRYLQQAGFKVFCAVGSGPYIHFGPEYLLMDRRHIDGISLCTQADLLRDLFNSESIVDYSIRESTAFYSNCPP